MDKLHEERNVENELTDSTATCRLEGPNKMQIDSMQGLVHSEIIIKTEPQADESDFHVTPENSSEICPDYDIKDETDKLMINIEREDLFDELLQDPLDVGGDIKGGMGEHFLSELSNIRKTNDKELANKNLARNNKIEYACGVCHKLFKEKGNYDAHLRIHTGEKPFTCQICQKSFNRKGTLNDHMIMHSGEKPHECDVCKKSFRFRADLKKHKWIHSSEKPYTCNICNKSFRQNPHYLQHLRVHTGVRPYPCDVCDKKFIQKSHLTVHRRFHTGEKPYTCDICYKSFTRLFSLNTHKKIHNN